MTWIILVLLVAAIAAPWVMEQMRKPMTERTQRAAPGAIVPLGQGSTHLGWLGPVRGPVLVAVHGLSTPSPAWYAVAEGLGKLGFRVLVYDLYGRGYSDTVSGPQDRDFFLRQLEDVLEAEGLHEDLTLMGYSMGAQIVTAYAARHPDAMKRLILVAPSGIVTNESGFSRFCRQTPVIGDWLHGLLGAARMRTAIAANSKTPSEVPDIYDIQRAELKRRGFLPAVLSSRRGMLDDTQEAEHRLIGREGIPVVGLWGDKDPVIPLRALGTLTQWNRTTRGEVIKGADHGLPFTHATQVVEVLRDVLREG